jgi:hypothetical protein
MPLDTDFATKIWYRYQFVRDNGHSAYVEKSLICDRFFEGDQWSASDREMLRQARRPALTINKIISTVGNVMGEQIYNRSEISFRPKSGASATTADTLTKVFKHISDNNQLDWKRSDMFADGIISSRGFLDIRVEFNDSIQGEVKIENINPKNVMIDNDADQFDPDTWNEVFVTKWMTVDDIAIMYNKADSELLRNRTQSYYPYGYDSIDINRDRFGVPFNPAGGQILGYDMSPVLRNHRVIERQHRVLDRQEHFVNTKTGEMRPIPEDWDRNRIALVCSTFGLSTMTKIVKRIRWSVISDNVKLHDDWSPYNHFTVVPYFPYFRRGHTIGLVENLIGPQEMLNKISSQELHVINTTANSGWKVKTGALANMSIEELEQNGARTGLVIEYNNSPDDIEKIQPNNTPQGLDRLSYKAEEHIKTISGVSDSQQGMDREDVAAKAIQAKRQAASTNMAKPLDSLVRTDYIIARNVLDLVQTFYTEDRILAITHDSDNGEVEQVAINQVTPEGEILNDLTVGEYSVTISSVPQRETLEDSQFDQAVALKELGIAIPDNVIIKSSRLLNKNDIIKQMESTQNSPEAQKEAELRMRDMEAGVTKTEAEAAQKQADAGLKQAKTQKEAVTAQKTAQTPPDAAKGSAEADIMKAQADIQLEREKFELDKSIRLQEFALKEREAALSHQSAQQKAADMMVQRRLAAQSRTQPGVDK